MRNIFVKTGLFFLILLTFSCAKTTEYLEAASTTSFMKAKVDGKLVECSTSFITFYDVGNIKTIQIMGNKGTEAFSITINEYKGVGTYDLGKEGIAVYLGNSTNAQATTYMADKGTLKITGSTDKLVTGTFEFTGSNAASSAEKKITEGTFSISVEVPKGTTPNPNPNPSSTTYYLSLKVDNKAVNLDSKTALRGQVDGNNTLAIQASAKDNKNPKLSFYHPGSFIGIVKGLNIVGFDKNSDSELKYTNEAGKEYSTKLDADGGYFTILDVKYEKGGYVEGIFSGSLTSSDKSKITITEGLFKVQFSN